ncbi:DUF4367 domain-containing protein [Brevibacillus borstelensis]|uniref:DUF4367 domain-containing protein n=1 Tax=Brevibacillus borstelensis TaxID=45462 RepID=UPI0030BE4835
MKKKTNIKKQISAYALGAMLLASFSPASAASDAKAAPPQSPAPAVNQTQLSKQPASSKAEDKVTVISKQAGFDLHFPSYIPGDRTSVTLNFSEKTKHVAGSFFSQTGLPFYLEMWRGDIAAESKGLTKIATKKGAAYQGTQKEAHGDVNVLIWEEEKGILYRLTSKLSQEELVKIAESVEKGNKVNVIEDSDDEQVLVHDLDTAKASELFGAPVKIPAYLPSNVKKESLKISANIYKGSTTIDIYDGAAGVNGSYFTLVYEKGALSKEDTAEMKPVQLVQGTAFAGTASLMSFMHPELKQLPILVWEKDGVVYNLKANTSIEELKKIAESL